MLTFVYYARVMVKGNTYIPDLIHLHIIVIILGFTGVLGKLISLEAVEMVWYRMFLAAAGLLLWLMVRKQMVMPSIKNVFIYMGTGCIVAAHWVAFFGSIKASTVSVALACFSATTLFTSMLEPMFNRTRISRIEFLLGVIIMTALFIIFRFEARYTTGIILGILSALLGAFFMVLNKRHQRFHKPAVITFYEMAGGFIGISFYLMLSGESHVFHTLPSYWDTLWLGILALVCTSYAFMASIKVMRSLSAFHVVLTINLEPVYGILLAILFFGETEWMSPQFYVGTALLLLSVLSYSYLKKVTPRSRIL